MLFKAMSPLILYRKQRKHIFQITVLTMEFKLLSSCKCITQGLKLIFFPLAGGVWLSKYAEICKEGSYLFEIMYYGCC